MSVTAFVIAYLSGAAVLALWIDVRFPRLRPPSWMRLGIAVAGVMLIDDLCTGVIKTDPPIVGVICVALPALVVTMLVSLWMLRMMRSVMPT